MLSGTSAALSTASTVGVGNLALQSSFPPSFFTPLSFRAVRICAAYARSAVDATSEAKASDKAAADTPERNDENLTFLNSRVEEKVLSASASQQASSHALDEAAYEEVNLHDMEFDALDQLLLYPCPCGDLFELSLSELRAAVAAATDCCGWAVAFCPACSLRIKVLFDFEQVTQIEERLGLPIIIPEAATLKRIG